MSLKRKSIILFLTIFCILSLFMCCFPLKAQAVEVSQFSYYDPNIVSFKNVYNLRSQFYDGNYMAFEINSTASDGKSHKLTITLSIANTNTIKQYTAYTDGINRKFDHIPIGTGGSYVTIVVKCSDPSVTVNMDLKMYSWQQ